MFGKASKSAREEAERQAAREKERREQREASFKLRFDQAKSEDETTRIVIDYRADGILEWLNDFDRRNAAEMRAHARRLLRELSIFGAILLIALLWL